MSAAAGRARKRKYRGQQQRTHERGRRRPAYTPPTIRDLTTCEVWVWADQPTIDPATQGARCGLPRTHLGYVKGQPEPTFPLCDGHARQWPLPVVRATLDDTAEP